jgi:hypothetical protein
LTAGPSFIGRHEEGVSGRQDRPRGTSRTCADGLHRRHDKGRPGLTRYAQSAGDDRPGGALRVCRRLAWAPAQHVRGVARRAVR